VAWRTFRCERYGEDIPALVPPPQSLGDTVEAWQAWYGAMRQWLRANRPNGAVAWPPFPPDWQASAAALTEDMRAIAAVCVLCGMDMAVCPLCPCPGCGHFLCRSCLYLSRDVCPLDGYVSRSGRTGSTAGR
jgi:hypothetical protein